MRGFRLLIILFLTIYGTVASAQVRIRVFSVQSPESALFSVIKGNYSVNAFNGETIFLNQGESVIIGRYKGKLAVKTRKATGFVCDSLSIKGTTGDDSFSLRINERFPLKQYYSGDFKCFPDMGTLVLINICNIEKYIAGVVKAEGGKGKNIEYCKSQAVIARTYMYKYFDKHLADKYNVCDDIHCQAFNGLSDDSLIERATLETRDIVILDHDSTLITAAFHSNCGGETTSSESVWLASQKYLKSVIDPFCLSSRNAKWEKKILLNDWIEYIDKSGYNGQTDDPAVFNFMQKSRLTNYSAGSCTIPLRTMRSEMNLRSTFFSVFAQGDTIILKGRGYGHGVGLCQEGAMEMAARGFNYKQIIDFYYTGVVISDVKNAVVLHPLTINPLPPEGGSKTLSFKAPLLGGDKGWK
ncbi:MAG: SpoIID/LytB domain-containing protein [Bacteroidales bacterium]|nr:SpoIID/LytB domain-containing protein [Bacteroidales bacterium]